MTMSRHPGRVIWLSQSPPSLWARSVLQFGGGWRYNYRVIHTTEEQCTIFSFGHHQQCYDFTLGPQMEGKFGERSASHMCLLLHTYSIHR